SQAGTAGCDSARRRDRNVLKAPGRLRTIRSDSGKLLLGEALFLHVRPDALRHLRGPDGLGAHDVLQRVAAALEVDRVAAERYPFCLRHSVSSLRRVGL